MRVGAREGVRVGRERVRAGPERDSEARDSGAREREREWARGETAKVGRERG